MGGCPAMLLTLPIMFALYWPISQPLKYLMNLSAAQIDACARPVDPDRREGKRRPGVRYFVGNDAGAGDSR